MLRFENKFGQFKKRTYICKIFRQNGNIVESAFSLYSADVNFDNSLLNEGIKMEMNASVGLYSELSIYNLVEQFRVPLFSFTGSRSPTSVIGLQWAAPLSLY